MKKFLLSLFVFTLCVSLCRPALAFSFKNKNNTNASLNEKVINQKEVEIQKFYQKFVTYTQNHNIESLKALYSDEYINTDNLNKEDFFKMVEESWKNFSDLKINPQITSMRIFGDYATIQTIENLEGVTAKKSDITGDIGILSSFSDNLIYLKKYGKTWKIYSERTLFEKTTLKYGTAKEINANIYAPDQVFSGSSYTSSVNIDLPQGFIALGSITNEPIVYPQIKTEEVFRQINQQEGTLERVLKANCTNNNELTVGSIGLTQLANTIYTKPEVSLTGLIVLIQRVNVIPKPILKNAK